MNATEFVRVRVNDDKFTHSGQKSSAPTPVQGSRASEFVLWRAWTDFVWDGAAGKWIRKANTPGNAYNENALQSLPEKDLYSPPVV
ncbi:MAG: hypothetical protein K2X82_27605 [Gemmataceae bacterium]|nr:hypothetical protein [Gemmataceae bacterium]